MQTLAFYTGTPAGRPAGATDFYYFNHCACQSGAVWRHTMAFDHLERSVNIRANNCQRRPLRYVVCHIERAHYHISPDSAQRHHTTVHSSGWLRARRVWRRAWASSKWLHGTTTVPRSSALQRLLQTRFLLFHLEIVQARCTHCAHDMCSRARSSKGLSTLCTDV